MEGGWLKGNMTACELQRCNPSLYLVITCRHLVIPDRNPMLISNSYR